MEEKKKKKKKKKKTIIQYNVIPSVNTIVLEMFVVPSKLITHSHNNKTSVDYKKKKKKISNNTDDDNDNNNNNSKTNSNNGANENDNKKGNSNNVQTLLFHFFSPRPCIDYIDDDGKNKGSQRRGRANDLTVADLSGRVNDLIFSPRTYLPLKQKRCVCISHLFTNTRLPSSSSLRTYPSPKSLIVKEEED